MDAASAQILSHFLSDISATRDIVETYRSWSVRCGPFRVLQRNIEDLMQWKSSERSILLMIFVYFFIHDPLATLASGLSASSILFWYSRLLQKSGVIGRDELENVSWNLEYNRQAMKSWCKVYDRVKDAPDSSLLFMILQVVICVMISLFLLPKWALSAVINGILLFQLPELEATVSSPKPSGPVYTDATRFSYEVFENQRWWLGSWSDKGLAIGTSQVHSWSDASGNLASKSSFKPPDETWAWDGLWHVDNNGWEYATNFGAKSTIFHTEQQPSHFVRRRRWLRSCAKKF